jgi:hypothetical protein
MFCTEGEQLVDLFRKLRGGGEDMEIAGAEYR